MGREARANRLADNPSMAGQDLGGYDLYADDFGRGDHHMGEFDNMRRGPFHEKNFITSFVTGVLSAMNNSLCVLLHTNRAAEAKAS